MSKLDVGLFVSTWYPGVNLERGDILCCLVLWVRSLPSQAVSNHELWLNILVVHMG